MNYQIIGEPLPAVICNVDANETLITERGSMSWMTPNMKMETTTNGGIGKAFGRMFSGESIFQSGFLASEASVELSIHFQKRLGAGFFGGEGFIMQRLSGHGIAFVEIDGFACEYNLALGQQMVIDTRNGIVLLNRYCQSAGS